MSDKCRYCGCDLRNQNGEWIKDTGIGDNGKWCPVRREVGSWDIHEPKLDSSDGTENFRFKVGDEVWVRDRGTHGGFRIEKATVREVHSHPDRHPAYPNGEGYALDGNLWWDCYPGCRVFATKEAATAARLNQ